MQLTRYRKARPSGNGKPVYIKGLRSPFVKSFGVFENSDALKLFSSVTDGLIRDLEIDPMEIDEIIASAVVPQTKNPNVARDAALALGLPKHIHGYTLNRACTSSMQTIGDAAKSIAFGDPSLILAGGVESLSDVPIVYSEQARKFLVKMSKAKSAADKLTLLKEFSAKAWVPKSPSLSEPLTGLTMGQHAEVMAKYFEVAREEQDAFALASHQKAAKAQESNILAEEIVPIWIGRNFETCVDADNIIRHDSTLEAMAKLRPAFDKKYGTITAANSSPLTDGAAVSLVADEERALSLGLKPKLRIVDVQFFGADPELLLIGPAIAIPKILEKNGLATADIDRFEIHEAFAAQVLCCLKAMASEEFCSDYMGMSKAFGEIPQDKLNVNGGAIAIGHPFAATGSRLLGSVANELHRCDGEWGLIAICAAGGMSGAMLVQRYS